LNISICDATNNARTTFLGLQILIFKGAGLQILLNVRSTISCVGFAIRHHRILASVMRQNDNIKEVRPEGGNQQSALGNALGMWATNAELETNLMLWSTFGLEI